jgi:hypothetical protein
VAKNASGGKVRARDIRDVVEIILLPSLERAYDELYAKGGSRRKARILIAQSIDQLRMICPPPAPARPVDDKPFGHVDLRGTASPSSPTDTTPPNDNVDCVACGWVHAAGPCPDQDPAGGN